MSPPSHLCEVLLNYLVLRQDVCRCSQFLSMLSQTLVREMVTHKEQLFASLLLPFRTHLNGVCWLNDSYLNQKSEECLVRMTEVGVTRSAPTLRFTSVSLCVFIPAFLLRNTSHQVSFPCSCRVFLSLWLHKNKGAWPFRTCNVNMIQKMKCFGKLKGFPEINIKCKNKKKLEKTVLWVIADWMMTFVF